jgi:hypothetical protein
VTPAIATLPAFIGDSERVRQILVNLLSNAVKCTEPGGTITIDGGVTPTPDPKAKVQPRGSHLHLSVTDTGSGIEQEKLADIFEPFVQADSGPKRSREGSGLGLTIGLRLARAMGGDLTVDSKVGVGSSFTLWLPADETAVQNASVDAGNADDEADTDSVERQSTRDGALPRNLEGLCELSETFLLELGPLVAAVVGRVRLDPALSMAAGLRTSQVTNHLTTLLADIAGALVVIEESGGEMSPLLTDAVAIQRLLAERHGAQRARLGWTEASLRREFMIIREEVESVVRRAVPGDSTLLANDAVGIVNRFIDQAEYLSVRALERARVS